MHIYTFILIMVYEVNLHRSPSNLRPYSARKAPVLLPRPFPDSCNRSETTRGSYSHTD